jgi:2-dehydro-3-deoxyphosphogalactonate aldolase
MTAFDQFKSYLSQCPLVAIIRGVTPDEAEMIGEALFSAGIRIIEVPLNSPEPIESIRRLSRAMGERALIGAGTVLEPEQVAQVAGAGGRLIVAPNVHTAVIEATVAAGLVSAPGYFTPSEAFEALRAGAHCLKLFPAEAASAAVVKAQRAVIPKAVPLLIVGGVRPDNMKPYLDAGADGFGLGSGVYRPGQSAAEVATQAQAYVEGLVEGSRA